MRRQHSLSLGLFLILIEIGLWLMLFAWWGSFYRFLLPAVVQGQANWGTAAWLTAELLLILFCGNRFFEESVRQDRDSSPGVIRRTKSVLYAAGLCLIGSLWAIMENYRELNVEHLPAGVQLRFVLAAGIPLLAFCAAFIWAGWRWGERLRAAEETDDAGEQRSLADARMKYALTGVGKYALLTAVWLLLFAAAWWVRSRFFG